MLLDSMIGLLLLMAMLIFFVLKKKNMHIWIVSYVMQKLSAEKNNEPVHVLFCFADHFEPQWHNRDNIELERERVDRWILDYPKLCEQHRDADGRNPQHSFFYPEEEYRAEHLQKLADLCQQGYGEVEIHLHHDDDNSDNLRKTLNCFAQTLHQQHGLLTTFPDSDKPVYAFIHGNWSLDNSRPDGKWCGVNDELIVLQETGCYVDMTLPSAPSDTQTRKINSIYYATDDPKLPKSHDTGVDVTVGGQESGHLMLIQGPLALNWKQRKWGFLPKIEASDVKASTPPSKQRVDLWVKSRIHVKNKPQWQFIKIHTHGAQDKDMDTLLGQSCDDMHSYLETKYNDGENYVLHYVTAREMYNIAKAAEAGKTGNPNLYRDYILPPPTYKAIGK